MITEKKNTGLIVTIIVLVIVVIGLLGYIAVDKGVFNKKESTEVTDKGNQKGTEQDNQTPEEIKPLDLTKSLNTKGTDYINPNDEILSNYGLSMKVNDDKKSITLTIDWKVFKKIVASIVYGGVAGDEVETSQITGFDKEIKSVFIGELGQDAQGLTLFYLMDDGTVEYTKVFIQKTDNANNKYYAVNWTYENAPDGKITGVHFASMGAINGVSDVIKLYNLDAYSQTGAGWRTTIGATKDGSFYDLENDMK